MLLCKGTFALELLQVTPLSPCTQNEINFATPTLEQQQNILTWVWTLLRLKTTTIILCTTVLRKGTRIYVTYTVCILHRHSYMWSVQPFSIHSQKYAIWYKSNAIYIFSETTMTITTEFTSFTTHSVHLCIRCFMPVVQNSLLICQW